VAARKTSRVAADRPLDEIDLKILARLQAHGRLSMKALAAEVGLSVTPCIERVRKLERSHVIRGYHARLDPQALGLQLLVFVEIKLAAKSAAAFDAFRREVRKLPAVMECHLVSGEFDYLIKARIPEMNAYRRLLGDMLLGLPGARESRSYVVMEEIKESLDLVIPEA
jgi:Lrp/AsnC family leucine-responsive transcriptional regulator